MLYVKPEYYDKFACIADRCEATCCAGWQIVIDEAACERYKSEPGEYGAVLRERIDWDEGVSNKAAGNVCLFKREQFVRDVSALG